MTTGKPTSAEAAATTLPNMDYSGWSGWYCHAGHPPGEAIGNASDRAACWACGTPKAEGGLPRGRGTPVTVESAVAKKTAVAFGGMRVGMLAFDAASAGCVRYSTAVKRLRAAGSPVDGIAEFERDRKTAAVCPTHGEIADPIIALAENRIAFACPWCSGGEALEAWEAEGEREKRS